MKKLILILTVLFLTGCSFEKTINKYAENESIEICNFYTPEQNGNKDTWYMESVTGHYYFKQNYDLNQDGIVIAVFVNSEFDRVEDN
jgi:hypothetical protein